MRRRFGRRGRPRGLGKPAAKSSFDPRAPLRGRRHRSLSVRPVVGTPTRGARRSGRQTVGYGVHRVFRVGLLCLAAEEVSLAPSPPPASPERVAGREMGGRTRAKSWDIGFPTALRTFTDSLSRFDSSSRTSARAARECVNTRLRDPPDLRCRLARHLPSPSVQPVARLDCLSWDCPKIAPPSSWRHRSPLPEPPLREIPSGRACHSSSMFRPRGFPPPRRFAPPMPGACIATRSRPWGSSRFQTACPQVASPTARPSPGCLPCPSKPSPRSQRRLPGHPDTHANARDETPQQPRSTSPACCHAVHRTPCPLTLSLSSLRRVATVARHGVSKVGSVGPRGLPPRTGPLLDRRLPADRARCSPGLARIQRPLPHRERRGRQRAPGERQRPLPDPMTTLPRP
jgi:hypothetical protein